MWGGARAPVLQFCDVYDRFLAERIERYVALPAGSAAQKVAPKGMGFHTDEVLLSALAAGQFAAMRVFTPDDFRWNFLRYFGGWSSAVLTNGIVTKLYLLSGGRFPWARLGREISLANAARLALGRLRAGR